MTQHQLGPQHRGPCLARAVGRIPSTRWEILKRWKGMRVGRTQAATFTHSLLSQLVPTPFQLPAAGRADHGAHGQAGEGAPGLAAGGGATPPQPLPCRAHSFLDLSPVTVKSF